MIRPRTTPSAQPAALIRVVLSACLLFSGAAALMYEVLWLRQLSLVMGQTAYALSTVLTAFLGGLALGAYAGGRWTKSHRVSVALYAAIELAIGISALAMPALIAASAPLFGLAYRSLSGWFVLYNLVQFTVCGLLLLLPTVLMGTTLPVVTALLVRSKTGIAAGTGRLYALNSFGGAVGAGLAGFLLLPMWGMWRTGLVAATLNTLVALAAYVVHWRDKPTAAADTAAPSAAAGEASIVEQWVSPSRTVLALLYGLSGFAALTLEVGWARIVGLSIGSTMYGFTIILVTFITGLAAGSLLLPRFRVLTNAPVRSLFACHAVIALWSLGSLSYLGSLAVRVVHLVGRDGLTFERLIAGEIGLVFLTIVIPALAMGAMFPLVTALINRSVGSSGYAAGLSYAANTLGNIIGSLLAGFVFIPLLGMRGTIVLSGLVSAAVGILYLLPSASQRPAATVLRAATLAGAAALAAILAPPWNRELIVSAPFMAEFARLGKPVGTADELANTIHITRGQLVDYREGATGVTMVKQRDGRMYLYQDGLLESDSGSGRLELLAHLPLLLHGRAKNVLVIGLGAGHTLAGVLRHPVERVDCVEISSEVRDVADKYFEREALRDPRVHLIIGDGRNHLRHSGKLYDVIISQPSLAWVSGAAGLFTQDYFTEVRQHLAPHGVALSWFFAYSDDAHRSIVRAWIDTFPSAYLFDTLGLQNVLIGLNESGPLSANNVVRALRPSLQSELQRVGIGEAADLFTPLMAGRVALSQYSVGVPPNTDDNSYVAVRGLRDLIAPQSSAARSVREDPAQLVDPRLSSAADTAQLSARLHGVYERYRAAQAADSAGSADSGRGS